MIHSTFTMRDPGGVELVVHRWLPEGGAPKACVQVSHGLAEHAFRYDGLAATLCGAGYAVYADDHRGHGLSAQATGGFGRLGTGGWDAVVEGLSALSLLVAERHPGLPLFLVGHSWGSFLAQDFAQRHGSRLAGLVLSGSAGAAAPLVRVLGAPVAFLMTRLKGPDAPSELSHDLTFKTYDKAFPPGPAGGYCEWLTRDRAMADAAIADPLCAGFRLSNAASLEFSLGLRRLWRRSAEARLPRRLPVLILSGSEDPVSRRLKDVQALARRWRSLGMSSVTEIYYGGARHEVFNETNRGEVHRHLREWLDARLYEAKESGPATGQAG